MKTLTKISEKFILMLIMLLVMNVSCTSEEDVLPVQENPVEEQIVEIDEEEEEQEEEEVILPVRLSLEMEGHDFSEESSQIFDISDYSQVSGDVLEVNLVRMISGEAVYYKLPGKGYNEDSEYSLFYFLPTEEFNFPRVRVSLSAGNGEKYDKVVVLIRNAS